MARRDRKAPGKPARRSWRQAALGGLLVALGGALLGRRRAAAVPAAEPAAERRGPSKTPSVRKAKHRATRPAPAPVRTRHWPPPAPKPIAPDVPPGRPGHDAPAAEARASAGGSPGYERSDIRAGRVAAVIAASAAVLVVAIAGLFALAGYVQREARQGPPLTAQQRAVLVPPGPHLQDHPLHDIAMERQRESDLLDHYAWTDARHETARIPIARAQALVIGRSLDPVPDAAAAPARP